LKSKQVTAPRCNAVVLKPDPQTPVCGGIALARLLTGMVHVNDQTVNDRCNARWAAWVSPAMDRVLAASIAGTNSPNGHGSPRADRPRSIRCSHPLPELPESPTSQEPKNQSVRFCRLTRTPFQKNRKPCPSGTTEETILCLDSGLTKISY
jgi:hypothetical protein